MKRKIIANGKNQNIVIKEEDVYRYHKYELSLTKDSLSTDKFLNFFTSEVEKYMKDNGIDIDNKGMRFIWKIDKSGNVTVFLGHEKLAGVSPKHWTAGKQEWKDEGKNKFFKDYDVEFSEGVKSAEGEAGQLIEVRNNKREAPTEFYFVKPNEDVYALPAYGAVARTHFIVVTSSEEGTFFNNGKASEKWPAILRLISLFIQQKSSPDSEVMVLGNIGNSYQALSNAHVHITIDDNFPSFFPEDYGLKVNDNHDVAIPDKTSFNKLLENYKKGCAGLDVALKEFFKKPE